MTAMTRAQARFLCVAALGGAGILACAGGCDREVRDTSITMIPVAHLKALADRQARDGGTTLILIDPRPPRAFEEARIAGARNIRLPQVSPRSEVDPTIDQYRTIVVYGEDPASGVAIGMTKRLLAVGYSGVRFYAGGLAEWRARGYPIEGTGPAPVPPPTPPAPPAPPAAAAPEASAPPEGASPPATPPAATPPAP